MSPEQLSPEQLSPEQHRVRAWEHGKLGAVLAESGHEWAAVALFYSAYHLAKRALLLDERFDEPTTLTAINTSLTIAHRHAKVHKARFVKGAPRDFGVNDLVRILYPAAVGGYERLHQASCAVRYESGLSIPIESIRQAFDGFCEAIPDPGPEEAG